jgi:ribosomal protein L11 methyltransferase
VQTASPAIDVRFPPQADAGLADALLLLLDDLQPAAIDEGACAPGDESGPPAVWRVYFASAGARERAAAALARPAARLGLALTFVDVPDEPWVERTQAALRAVTVGGLVVAPPWDVPDADAARVVIVLPSTGFGTGHHATTRLCLRALQRLGAAGRTVLDLGTGSGVLAIAAVKLGATDVTGVDCDPDAIASARENLRLNGLEKRVALHEADLARLDALPLHPADVVLANLTAGVLQRFADAIRRRTVPGGTIVVSGVLAGQAPAVVAAFEIDGVSRLLSREDEEEWVGMVFRNATRNG